jgi:1,4-dihydroxy-2-naphthoyl-CoA hydrolase
VELSDLAAAMPFTQRLGVELTRAEPERVEGRLYWSKDLCTTGGMMHGGAIMGLVDSLGGICAFLNLPEGASTSTIESKTNFMRGLRAGELHASTVPVHVGRRTIVLQTEVRDGEGKLVALTTQTQAVIT